MRERDLKSENRINAARESPDGRNSFLSEEKEHILLLTARILKRTVSESDDEFSVALLAVSEAIDSYDENKGAFWSYAALVIKSRIIDEIRKRPYRDRELLLDPASFSGDPEYGDDDKDVRLRQEINEKTAIYTDSNLKYELCELEKELSEYGVDIFELPQHSPKSGKTKEACKDLIKKFFDPPPLTGLFRKKKALPVKEMLMRSGMNRKAFDRHRKFILASILIKTGDYGEIESFLE
ncbi:MAG: hypothetical protein J6O55_08425 [Lachnospiraceae bacterium]|nr:hypothetical protein [Lachnospiraceae bacterium]